MVGLGTGAPIVQVYHEKSIILPDVSRVLACLYEKDIKFETHTASYKSLLRLQASSHAPVPFYDGPTFLEESRGICRYIAEKYEHQGYPFLLGKDALERASVEQWLHNEEHAFNPPSRALYCHLAFPLDEDGDDIGMHTRKLEEVLEVYEQRLSDSRFLAGNKFTLADLVHLPNSHYITASDKFIYLYDSRKNVSRWWDEISNRESWQQVLRDMKRVEEQNRQEELKKQQQQRKEHPRRTSGHPIRIDSRTQNGTKPRTILVPPADAVSSSSIVPPHPTDTFPSEALVSSSQTTPTDKTSAVLSKETTVFNAPDEKPPTSVQNTPTTFIKHPIPVQSIKDDASPTTTKKPPVAYAAKSSTQDASIPEPTVKDLHTRHKPSSSKDGSNNLDVFDYYPSHTDEETPYIEPTPRRNSDMLDAFSGSNVAAGHTKTSSISAKEPDQPNVSDFYKSHIRAPGIDSQNRESIPYSGRTAPKLEPADTSGSKLHTTDVHRRLRAEQWHTATDGLNDLQQDADHLMSTQQGKPSKDAKPYPSQDSEQAISHPVPEEPTSMELVQRRENTTRGPYTDQRSQGIVEDKTSSDQRSALLLPSTQEHDATPSWQEAIPYSGRTVPKLEPTDISGSKLHTTDAHRRLRAEQWHTATAGLNDLQQDADHLMSTQQGKPSKDAKPYPSQDSEQAISHPVPEEPTSMELVQRRENTTRRPYTDQRTQGIVEDKTSSDQRSALLLPSTQEHDATPSWQEAIPYSGRTGPKLEPTDTSGSKLHTTDAHRRLRAEQWHTATAGLNDLQQDADHLVSTQQGKPSKDVKPYPSQDSEQAISHPVPEEPTSMELVQRQENTTRRPYTDQRRQGIAEDKTSSDQRSALLLPSTQEHAATPSWQEAAKDARGRIPWQAGYPGGQDTNMQPRDPASVPRQRAAQDARGTFGESKAADSTIPSGRFPDASGSSLSRQDLDAAHHTTASFQKRDPGTKDTSKQAKDKISTPWPMADKDAEDTTEETQISDSSSSQVQPLYFQKADTPPWKQETTEDRHSGTSAIQEKHVNVKDTTGISTDVAFKQKQTIGQDDQDTFKETKSGGPSLLRDQQTDTWQAASTLPEQEVNQDGRSVAPLSQTRYPSSTPPSKTRYQIAKDASKQPTGTAPTPKKKAAQDDKGTSEESNTADEIASTEQPLSAWRAPISPRRQEVENSSRMNTSFQKRYPDDEDGMQVADTASASRQITPDGRKDIFEETKPADSTTSAKPVYRQQAAPPLSRQAEVEDAQGKGRQSRVTIPEPQEIVARNAQVTHGERKTTTPGEQFSDCPQAIPQSRPAAAKDAHSATGETTNDQKLVPPLLSKEPTSQVQPSSESLQEAASRGDLSTEPSTIEQWQRASMPLNDATSSSGYDETDMATIDQKLTPMSQKATPSSEGVNQMAKESREQRVEPHVPVEAETSGVQSASPSFPGASTAHYATADDKFSKQSIIDERVGEPTKMQASNPAHIAAPDGHSELVSIPDGQISESAKTRHDQATLQEEVHDANLPILDVSKDTFKETKVSDSTPSSAKPMHTQQPGHAEEVEDTRNKGTKSRETVPDRQKMVERSTGTAGEQLSDRLKAIPPSRQAYREETIDDQKVAPPPLSRELTSQVQPPSEPSHDTALHGDLSSKPSTIDQWRHASAPLHDVTTGSGDDDVAMSAVDQKPTPMRHQESDEQRVGSPVPKAETSSVQRASPSFLGAPVDDHATIGDKFAKQSIIDERVGKPIQMQPSSPDAHPAWELTKRATSEGHETGDSDGQISEATKARDRATIHEDVNDVNLSTHDVGKDTFKETKVADSTPSNAKPMYTQQPAITPSRQTQVEEARDKSMQSRETIPEQQKMVERKTGISGGQSSDYKKAIHPSRQVAAAEDAPNGEIIQFPYIPDSSKKSRVTFEEAIGPGSTLPKAQALDSQDSQLTKGESTMPTADQRKDRKDAKDDETIMTEEKSFSTERLREMFQESESTTPKMQPTDSQDYSTVDKTFPVYQKGPLAAQIIQAGEKIDSSTPEHQESSGAPYTYDKKLSASALAGADIRDDHSAEDPYKKYTADDQKVAPSLSSKEPASQVQPLTAPFQRAVPDGDSPSKQFTIDQWQRASAPLHGVNADSGPKQMHEPITAAHPASASTIRTTPDGHEAGGSKLVRTPEDLEAAKATQDPDTIHENVHDASLSTHDAAIDENTSTYHASDDEVITGSAHDRQAHSPASTQAQTTVETPRDYYSSQYVQKSTPSDKGSSHATQPLSSVEPIKEDSNVSANDYANAPQMIFRQQARPSAPSTIGIPASDTQGVIGKIQEVTPDNRRTDDSEQVADASQAIPGQEEMTSPPGTTVFPTSDVQLASAEIQEVIPDDKQAVESITPLFSNGKQGSHVESALEPGEVGPPEKKFAPSDQELPHSAEQPTSGKPRKEQTVVPTAEQIKQQPTVIGQKDTPDTREALISEDVLDTTPTHGDVYPTGSIEPDSRPLSIKGEETQEPPPRVAKDSLDTEDISTDALGNVQSLKPSTTLGALRITTGSTPGDVAMAEQTSSTSGQDSADPAEPAFPLGPRNKEIRDSTPSGLLISSTDPGKRDAIIAVPDQAKDLQTIPSGQDILSNQRPSGKVQETVPGDASSKDKPFRPSSAVREGEPSKVVPASVPGIQLGSKPNEVPSSQDSAYPARSPSSAEARSKEIGDLAPSAQLNSTTEPRNGDGIVAAPDQAKDSETTPGQQVKLSAPSSYTQRPSGTHEEDEPADNPGEAKSSKPRSIAQEGKPSAAVPVSAPDTQHGQDSAHTTLPAPAPAPGTQYGTELHKADDEQKFASSGQDSVRSVQPAFSTDEQTKEDTVVAATDQTNTLEKVVDKKDMTPALDKAKTPFSGTPDTSRETQKSTDDDHIDEKHPSQGRISPYRHVSEPPKGPTPEVHSDAVIKETTLGSSQEETSKTRPDSRPTSSDVPAASSLPETQDLQGSAHSRNVPADSLQNIESPGHLSSDQALAPIMSPSVPSVAPLGTNSVQPPRKASMASTVDLESVPDTQHGTPRGEATPDKQKFAVSDQELPHTLEVPSSVKTRKEAANAATGDQPNVPQGPETVRHQVKAPSSDERETLQKYQQPSGAALPEQITHAVLPSDLRDQPTPEVGRNVVDKETTLLSSQAQTSAIEPDSTPISGDMLPTGSLQNQDAQPPAATQAPPTQSLQGSASTHDDSLGKFESRRQASTDQVMAPVSDSAAPSDASQVSETGEDSAESIQPPFSSEPTEDNTVVTAADQTKDMETATHQQAIAPAPESAKTPFPGTQDASRKIQESTPDNGHINEPFPSQEQMLLGGSSSQPHEGQITDPYETNVNGKTGTSLSSQANSADSGSDLAPTHTDVHPSVDEGPDGIYFPVPGAQKQLPAATEDVPLDSSSKTKSTDQESMSPTRDLASSPDTQHDSSQTQHEAAPAGQKFAVSGQGFSSASPSFAEPRKEETNAGAADQISVPQTTAAHKVPSATSDARESLWKDQESSRDGDYISNPANELVVSEGKASHAVHASEGPNSEVSSSVVDMKMTLPSSQAQTSSTGPESTPISDDTRLSSADVPAASSLQNEEVHNPVATHVPTTQVPLGSASTRNIPAESLEEIRSPRQPSTDQVMSPITSSAELSDAPQGTEPDQVSVHASDPPFSAEPSNEVSHAARAPESHEGTIPQVRSPVVDAKTILPSRQVQTANAGPDSTPISGDVPDRSSLQNQEAQLSAATQVPTVQAQGSASTKKEPADSLGDVKSPRQLPTDEVVAPITSFTAPSDSSQGTEPGTNSVQPSEEASSDFSSDEKPTTTPGDQAKTLPNGDLPTSQVVGQSESEDSRRVDSQENLKGSSTNENPNTQQQIEQFNTQSFKENSKKADEPGNQQPSEQAIVDSPEGNENQAEQTKLRGTETGGPEDIEASKNTNQKNNRISQVETSDHSGKKASGVQRLGENTKDAPNSTEDAPGDVQAFSKSKESSRSSEEPKVQVQSEDEAGETESPSSETGQPRGDLPANSYQNNSRQSQAEASDKSDEQSYPGIPNKDRDSGRADDSTDPTEDLSE